MPETRSKSMPSVASELVELVVAYAKQETVEPLKDLGRFVAFGVAGSLLVAFGLMFLVLAGLRALQVETGSTFEGNLTWAPYLITLAGCGLIAGLSARAIGSERRKRGRQ